MISPSDEEFMEQAFKLAEDALTKNEVPVGCVFVYNGEEIGRGQNSTNFTKNPTSHAEINALREMETSIDNFREILPEIELFVTLEPCIMCAGILYQLGIKRIVFGAANDRFGGIVSVGSRAKYNSENDIEIVKFVQSDRAIDLLKQFYAAENPFAPEGKKTKKPKKAVGSDKD